MCYSWQGDIPGRGNAFFSGCLSKLVSSSVVNLDWWWFYSTSTLSLCMIQGLTAFSHHAWWLPLLASIQAVSRSHKIVKIVWLWWDSNPPLTDLASFALPLDLRVTTIYFLYNCIIYFTQKSKLPRAVNQGIQNICF